MRLWIALFYFGDNCKKPSWACTKPRHLEKERLERTMHNHIWLVLRQLTDTCIWPIAIPDSLQALRISPLRYLMFSLGTVETACEKLGKRIIILRLAIQYTHIYIHFFTAKHCQFFLIPNIERKCNFGRITGHRHQWKKGTCINII